MHGIAAVDWLTSFGKEGSRGTLKASQSGTCSWTGERVYGPYLVLCADREPGREWLQAAKPAQDPGKMDRERMSSVSFCYNPSLAT